MPLCGYPVRVGEDRLYKGDQAPPAGPLRFSQTILKNRKVVSAEVLSQRALGLYVQPIS